MSILELFKKFQNQNYPLTFKMGFNNILLIIYRPLFLDFLDVFTDG
jgi:hypothetical protein